MVNNRVTLGKRLLSYPPHQMATGRPSSSAVTIPVPGKSILKRPPPQQPSLFSRFTRFLPSSSSDPHPPILSTSDDKPLKRAHFILPQIAIVYPISSFNPPSTPTLKDEKRAIEHQEADRRRKIVRGSPRLGIHHDEWWSMEKVDAFYRECCAGCDEEPDPAVSAAFKVHSVSFLLFRLLILYVARFHYHSTNP